jgi:cytochrome P450
MAPRIQQLVDAGLDRVADSGAPADLISELAAPLSLAVLGQLLGIPPDDNEKFRDWVEVLFDISASSPQQKARRRLELVDYMADLVGAKRARPGDDLITALIGRHEEGDLTAAEMLTLGLTLLMAGYETTIGQIGLTVLALLRDPATHRALREQPGLLPGAVEEFLRLSPSTPLSFPRVTLERVQLGTVTLGPGASVIVSLLHGNRDAKIFAEPARLCPEGRGAGHLTFGHGMHRCVGAPLARLEVEIVVARLLQRFPGLRLADDPGAVAWKDGLATRGLSRLSVAW